MLHVKDSQLYEILGSSNVYLSIFFMANRELSAKKRALWTSAKTKLFKKDIFISS